MVHISKYNLSLAEWDNKKKLNAVCVPEIQKDVERTRSEQATRAGARDEAAMRVGRVRSQRERGVRTLARRAWEALAAGDAIQGGSVARGWAAPRRSALLVRRGELACSFPFTGIGRRRG